MKRIEIIQLLRLFAAICIIIYHSGVVGENGYFAVEIFNTISGFIIVYSTQNIDSKKFFLRKRLIRILPLYWSLTLVMYGIIYVFPDLSIMSEAAPEYLIKSLLFLPFVNSKGYNAPILGVGWTLNYEMLFYIIFFISLQISHRYRAIISATIIVGLTAIGYLFNFENILFLDYYTDLYLLEFVWGILAFYIIEWAKKTITWKQKYVIYYGLAIISLIWLIINVGSSGNIHRCFRLGIPSGIFFAAILLCLEHRSFPPILLSLGDASFSIYLVEYFTTAFFKVVTNSWTIVPKTVGVAVIIALTIAVSFLCYQLIEVKITQFLKKNLWKQPT